jgi:hypothetical protein
MNRTRPAIRAELTGSTFCRSGEHTVNGNAPVLILCRELIAAGCDPDRALEVYRGATLALRIRSIGAAAKLDVNSKGTGFVRHRPAVRRGPPMRQNLTARAAL